MWQGIVILEDPVFGHLHFGMLQTIASSGWVPVFNIFRSELEVDSALTIRNDYQHHLSFEHN
jgi:hypothetical protein